jgi:pimeloyl-ACP methyl ester carboxylesterase
MYRKHGETPALVLHGGPGAIGSARTLARDLGAIELLNYGSSIQAQLEEIRHALKVLKLEAPILIGHSWGAWLAVLYAAKFPVKKVILIGCGPFDEKYLDDMQERRMGKLTEKEQSEAEVYFQQLSAGCLKDLSAFNRIMSKMDAYEMIGHDDLDQFDYEGHGMLMDEIRLMRRSGKLLEKAKKISCELIIFHGQDDPHPLEGIIEPFDQADISYSLHAFEKCGHIPWHELHAKKDFMDFMRKELEIG